MSNGICPCCSGIDGCWQNCALAQARAELEAEKKLSASRLGRGKPCHECGREGTLVLEVVTKDRVCYYCAICRASTSWIPDWGERNLREAAEAKAKDLQAKLAAAEARLNERIRQDAIRMDMLQEAESQAAELREKLEWAANNGGPWINNVITTFLSNLPASVQARAEREAAVQAIVKAAEREKRWNCWAPKNLEEKRQAEADWKELTAALARLAALDSAQKRDPQFDYETGECTHGLIGNYSTCNGDPRGCCRRWGPEFQHCCYHLKKEWDSAQKGERRP